MAVFEVQGLSYQYQKSHTQAVNQVDFKIEKGEIFGLLGPSGAGKSTTQKILTKLLEHYQGSVIYNDQELRTYGADYYEKIGVGFELPVHFNKLSGLENMQFFQNLYKTHVPIEPLLEQVGLLADKDKRVGEYSKGMKMRLNFVRALLNDPDFLFLDEVTNGLDPKNAKIIKDMILAFKAAGGTVLLTTHLMGDVEALCDRVAFIKNGAIIESDTPKALKIKYGERIVDVEYKTDKGLTKQTFDLSDVGKNDAFIQLLKTADIQTIHSGETSLEDIFILITGDTYDG